MNASKITPTEFSGFRISFEGVTTPIDTFFAKIKKVKPIIAGPVDKTIETFKKFTKEQLKNLSIDLGTISKKANAYYKTEKKEECTKKRSNSIDFNNVKKETIEKILLNTRHVDDFYISAIKSGVYNNDDVMIR